jgi:putative holliday junction resolvase
MARILGVDYGRKRLGFAVGDSPGGIAFPLRVETVRGAHEAVAAVIEAVRQNDAAEVVLGLPVNMDGTHGPMAAEVEAFAETVRARLDVPVRLVDERMTSQAVDRVLIGKADLSRGRRKQVRDKLAAQQILQGYLDRDEKPAPPPDGVGGHPSGGGD